VARVFLTTPRLLYVPTPLSVLRERLVRSEFIAQVVVPSSRGGRRRLPVRFTEEWPGPDALPLIGRWIARRESSGDDDPWSDGVVILRAERLAVGSMGFKGPPDQTGTVEIGYATNGSMRGRGYATEMASALAAWALAQPGVRRITAECLAANRASVRVLQKSGFRVVGRRPHDDGVTVCWELPAPALAASGGA
jgi:ribosomal-protein-alanine N-acetyltransferase